MLCCKAATVAQPHLHLQWHENSHSSAAQVFNNVIHDIDGPGLAVFGGYNLLIAHNTFYRVGQGTDFLMLIRPGRRTCDGEWVGEWRAAGGRGAVGAVGINRQQARSRRLAASLPLLPLLAPRPGR